MTNPAARVLPDEEVAAVVAAIAARAASGARVDATATGWEARWREGLGASRTSRGGASNR